MSERRTGGPATVLLHGAAGSWTTWTPLLQAAATDVCAPGDLIVIDLPGWGGSPLPDRPLSNGRSSLTADAYAGAVRDAVEALGYHSWHLLGHSLGGLLALHLAVQEPVRTRSVCVVSPTGPAIIDSARHPLLAFRRNPGFAGLRAVMAAFAPLGGTASMVLRGLDRLRLLRPAIAPLFARPEELPRGVGSALAAEVRPQAFEIAARVAAGYDPARWAAIRCPVRAVRGDRDVFSPAADDARLTELIPGLTVSALRGIGHFAHVEAPFAVLDALDGSVCDGAGRAGTRR